MANEYTIEAVREEQERLYLAVDAQNIRRLQKKVNDAKAELEEAQLQRQNRIMGGKDK